jgi:hypothetical protein
MVIGECVNGRFGGSWVLLSLVGSWGILLDAADSSAGVGFTQENVGRCPPETQRPGGLLIELFPFLGFLLACPLEPVYRNQQMQVQSAFTYAPRQRERSPTRSWH